MQINKSLFLYLSLIGFCPGAVTYQWPDAPPPVLREELFGIRYFLLHEDRGAAATKQFLETELAKRPAAPVKAYLARVCLLGPELDSAWSVDHARGMRLAQEAADAGSAVAADLLGKMKIFGEPADRDEKAGMALLRTAANLGHARALARYGFCLMLGKGGETNHAAGNAMIKEAAALGSTLGLGDVARAYELGWRGQKPDLAQAMEYYFQMARYNDGTGRRKLDEFAAKGVPGADLYREIAAVSFANEGGGVVAATARQICASLEARKANDPRAWLELGVAHLFGEIASRDHALALDYLRRAVAAGQKEAAFFIAMARMEGWGQPREARAGLEEMQALADAGDVRAANRLGTLFYWGAAELPGGRKDPVKAFRYIRQGAEGGYIASIANLAFCYEHGIGVPENSALAAKVYWAAYDRGYHDAKEKVRRHLAFAKIR
jgi:TPR repeat protein